MGVVQCPFFSYYEPILILPLEAEEKYRASVTQTKTYYFHYMC